MTRAAKNAGLITIGVVSTAATSAVVSNTVSNVYTMPVLENRMLNLERDQDKAMGRLEARVTAQEAISNTLQGRMLGEMGDLKRQLGRVEGQLDILTQQRAAATLPASFANWTIK